MHGRNRHWTLIDARCQRRGRGLASLTGYCEMSTVRPDPYRQWALYRCGFPDVWPVLDTGPDPGEIAVIDRGEKGLNHRELAGRVTRRPTPSRSSRAAHAAAVAAVIAARRDDHEGDADGRMDGCCSARVRVYSAWDADDDSTSKPFGRHCSRSPG